ncbi:MAG TPA: metallophosphoesterase, partial [Gemmatimonadaceae bacterium]
VLTGLFVYGSAIEPRFVVRNNETGTIPNLPAVWEGQRIAVFADLQVGMWWANTDAARRVVREVVELRPAAVLIAGDFVYNADSSVDDQMREVLAILHPIIDSHIPTYAVLGNHDYSLMNEHSDQENAVARRVRIALDSAGIHMMDNRVTSLRSPADTVAAAPDDDGVGDGGDASAAPSPPLYIVGIGEKWAKNDHGAETLAKVPAGSARVVFMHDPDSYAHLPAGEAPLAIAAHTHGLQVGVPYVTDWLWRHRFSDEGSGVEGWIGHYGEPGNHLYVNRGIGFSFVPARVHAAPELTVFTLTRGK